MWRTDPPACDGRADGLPWVDFFHYSLVPILFVLGIVAVPVVLGLVCYGLYLLLGPGS